MPRRRHLLALPLLLPAAAAWPLAAAVQPPAELRAELPDARLQGAGHLRYFGFRVYDIQLWTGARPAGDDWAAVPLALSIVYARHLAGKAIAARSLEEMRRQAEIEPAQAARWLAAMETIFPDVDAGDRITGVQRPGASAGFYVNGRPAGGLADAGFTRLFFGIWLSPRSSEPGLRAALLGKAP